MGGHKGLLGYSDNAAATAAADAVQAMSEERTPYRVWQCTLCYQWHAAPWANHGHDPEVDSTPGGTVHPVQRDRRDANAAWRPSL